MIFFRDAPQTNPRVPREEKLRKKIVKFWRWRKRWERFRNGARAASRWAGYWLGPIWFAVILAVLIAGSLYLLRGFYAEWSPIGQGIYVEVAGAIFDIVVFGVIIAFILFLRDRRQRVERLQEEIDDFKKWDNEEARYRIAGAIRRLNRLGKTDIDFGGVELREFSFRRHDIKSISGSTFYDGTWGTLGSRDKVKLERVDFSALNCRNVVFSKLNPFVGFGSLGDNASFINCDFSSSDLRGAIFKGAHLEWTEEHPNELGAWHDHGDGNQSFEQVHWSPFGEAELMGASFEDALFMNADFRQARDILSCNFSGAKRLETCLFDNDEIKGEVIKLAQQKKQN